MEDLALLTTAASWRVMVDHIWRQQPEGDAWRRASSNNEARRATTRSVDAHVLQHKRVAEALSAWGVWDSVIGGLVMGPGGVVV